MSFRDKVLQWATGTENVSLGTAFQLGEKRAFEEAGMSKDAGIESRLGDLAVRSAHLWVPAAGGAVAAGPEHRTVGALAGLGAGILGKRLGLEGLRRSVFAPGRLSEAMRAARLPETSTGYRKLVGLGSRGSGRGYERIGKELGEDAPAFWDNVASMQEKTPITEWGGRVAGGVGGGLLAKELLSDRPGSSFFQTSPAVSDAATHYTGLVPGDGYY